MGRCDRFFGEGRSSFTQEFEPLQLAQAHDESKPVPIGQRRSPDSFNPIVLFFSNNAKIFPRKTVILTG
jgi:hypothetical protein